MEDLQELNRLRESLLKQSKDINSEIIKVSDKITKLQKQNEADIIKKYPYYKDKNSILYITKKNSNSYIITKITYSTVSVVGISTFSSNNINFLRSYNYANKLDWDRAITQLNAWLSDANVKLENVGN